MTEFTKLTPSYQGGEFAKPEHVIEVQEAFAPIESELADHEGRVTAAELVTPLVRQPSYVAALGDSITIGNGSNGVDVGSGSYLTWACAASGGALVPLINGFSGVSGNTTSQMLARITDITNLDPKPSRCLVMGGTNDANGSLNMTNYKSNIQAIISALLEAHIEPVLLLIPPKDANHTEVAQINAWLSLYGASSGVQVIDLYTPYQDGATGQWAGTFDQDGTHPTTATSKLMGEVIWSQLKDRIQPKSPVLLTAHASDPYNLVTNGIFVGDTNSDGCANNWVEASGAAGANDELVSGGSTVPGNWQKVTLAMNGAPYYTQTITGWSVGDVLLFAARVRASISGSERFGMSLALSPGARRRPINSCDLSTAGDDGQIFAAIIRVPTGTTAIVAQLLTTAVAVGGTVEFAQVTVRNLTALGIV